MVYPGFSVCGEQDLHSLEGQNGFHHDKGDVLSSDMRSSYCVRKMGAERSHALFAFFHHKGRWILCSTPPFDFSSSLSAHLCRLSIHSAFLSLHVSNHTFSMSTNSMSIMSDIAARLRLQQRLEALLNCIPYARALMSVWQPPMNAAAMNTWWDNCTYLCDVLVSVH